MENREDYITRKELHEEISAITKRTSEVVREQVHTAETHLSKQLHSHITARFQKSKTERDGAHKEIIDLITSIKTSNDEISKKLAPIAKNYEAVGVMGKWILAILTFITILVTALANAKAGLSQLVNLIPR